MYKLYDEWGMGSYACAINTVSWGTLYLVQYVFYAISRTAIASAFYKVCGLMYVQLHRWNEARVL